MTVERMDSLLFQVDPQGPRPEQLVREDELALQPLRRPSEDPPRIDGQVHARPPRGAVARVAAREGHEDRAILLLDLEPQGLRVPERPRRDDLDARRSPLLRRDRRPLL